MTTFPDFTFRRENPFNTVTFFPILPTREGYQLSQINWTFDSTETLSVTHNFSSFTYEFLDRPEPSDFVTSRSVKMTTVYVSENTITPFPDLIFTQTRDISIQQSYQLILPRTVDQNSILVPQLTFFDPVHAPTTLSLRWNDPIENSSLENIPLTNPVQSFRFSNPGDSSVTVEFLYRGNLVTITKPITVNFTDEPTVVPIIREPPFRSVQELINRLTVSDNSQTSREIWGGLAAVGVAVGVSIVAWKVGSAYSLR